MIQQFLHSAWRQWRASALYSVLNLGGLTTGMAVVLLIGLWIADEMSFDHCFSNHSRIVKVIRTAPSDAGLVTSDLLSPPLFQELRTNYSRFFRHLSIVFPNFPHALTVSPNSGTPNVAEKNITAEGQWAQPEWPEILSVKMLRGSRDALNDPSSTLIDQSTAISLFGPTDPMGRTIRVDNTVNVKVAGIYEDLPADCSFAGIHILLAWNKAAEDMSWFKNAQRQWDAAGFWVFGELNDEANAGAAAAAIRNVLQTHLKGSKDQLSLYPMDRWHLYSEFHDGKSASGRIRIVGLFTLVGAIILLLACINFMNLATARSERRAREVGIRKTLGSRRYQLITQFLGESIVLALLALLLTIALAQLCLPLYDRLAGKELQIPYAAPAFWGISLAFTLFTGFISGSYPAFYLSGFRPVKVLTGRYRSSLIGSIARKSLVVLQYTVSISLIIATCVIYQQIAYARARPVGYNREGLMAIRMNTSDIYNAPYNSLRDDLLKSGAVLDIAQSANSATERPPDLGDISWAGKNPASRPAFTAIEITHDFGRTIGWTISAGRDFSREFATDSSAILINETAARLIAWKDPIGKSLRFWGEDYGIVGVAKDIVAGSPYQPVPATIFPLSYRDVNYITMRLNPTLPVATALDRIGRTLKHYNPQAPFDPIFLADDYALKFATEQQVGRLSTLFATLAIFISCLGLFGLAAYVFEQRTREIGIRKVLGASVSHLLSLLSADFLKLILLSLCVAIPVSAWAMHRWLRGYPYHARLQPWIFAAAGAATILIALLTVSFQALKAALANPVQSLRAE